MAINTMLGTPYMRLAMRRNLLMNIDHVDLLNAVPQPCRHCYLRCPLLQQLLQLHQPHLGQKVELLHRPHLEGAADLENTRDHLSCLQKPSARRNLTTPVLTNMWRRSRGVACLRFMPIIYLVCIMSYAYYTQLQKPSARHGYEDAAFFFFLWALLWHMSLVQWKGRNSGPLPAGRCCSTFRALLGQKNQSSYILPTEIHASLTLT